MLPLWDISAQDPLSYGLKKKKYEDIFPTDIQISPWKYSHFLSKNFNVFILSRKEPTWYRFSCPPFFYNFEKQWCSWDSLVTHPPPHIVCWAMCCSTHVQDNQSNPSYLVRKLSLLWLSYMLNFEPKDKDEIKNYFLIDEG